MDIEKCSFKGVDQVINMGGPWVGDFYYDDSFISKNVIVDNLLFSDNKVYFVKYHSLSKKRSDIFFTICCWDIDIKSLSESTQTFNMLYLKEITSAKRLLYVMHFTEKYQNHALILSSRPKCFILLVTKFNLAVLGKSSRSTIVQGQLKSAAFYGEIRRSVMFRRVSRTTDKKGFVIPPPYYK